MYRADTQSWYLERVIFLIAGCMILLSLALAHYFSSYWLILTALVGINLLIFALTGLCPMANLLYAVGIRPRSE